MNARITGYKKIIFSALVFGVMSINAAAPEKCKPCQAAAAAKLAAAAAKLAAQQAAAQAGQKQSKPKHKPKKAVALDMIEACCAYCEQPGSLGCQGENSFRCNTCQAGLLKMSIAEAAALAALNALNEAELDEIPALDQLPAIDVLRAPREALEDPCFVCPKCPEDKDCSLDCKLQAIFNCCVNTNQQVRCSAAAANKCCKKTRHKLDNIEDDVDDIMDAIGDVDVTIVSLQDCGIDVLDFVNTNNDDVITWLKRLYVLMYQVFSCSCCIEA